MNMTKILSIVFFVVAIGLAYYLTDSIKYSIDEQSRIENIENSVINKLKMIRDAQVAYRAANGQYTSTPQTLIDFVKNGNIYITQKTETLIPLDYGADSLVVNIDTLGTVSVMDSLFKESKYPNFDPDRLLAVPGGEGAGEQFEMFADKIVKGGVQVDVFEVRDPSPVNPARQANNNERALRVGSRTEVTTSGNWE